MTYHAVYYPDGDFKCVCDTYEEAKKESKGYSRPDIREIDEEERKCLLLEW